MMGQFAKVYVTVRTKLILFSSAFLLAMVVLPAISPLRAGENGAEAANGTGNAESGKQLFEKRCTGCHSLDQNREGPRLRDVYGRKAGSVPTFKYSDGLKAAHITWGDASLDKWLTDPESLVPDTDMEFHVPKASERADIIRFLRLSSGK